MGSPALGQGSNCKLLVVSGVPRISTESPTMCILNARQSPLSRLDYRTCSSNSALSLWSASWSGFVKGTRPLPENMVTTFLSWFQLYPSMTSWCALATSVNPLLWLKASEISCPNVYPAPRGLMPQPHRSSGSLQSRSHIGPSWGTSWIRSNCRMLSRVSMLGERPPWRQNIWLSMSAVSGR